MISLAVLIPPSMFEVPCEGKPAVVSLQDASGSIPLAIWKWRDIGFNLNQGPKACKISHLKGNIYSNEKNLLTTGDTEFSLVDKIKGTIYFC